VRLPVEEGTADEHVEPPVEVTEWDVDAGIPELPRMGEITADAADDEHRADGLTEDELVLVVEDNHDVRAYIVENLTDFRVQEAGNGETGLNLAIELTPDLIITDVMMPEMDGFELARHLRSDQRTSHIPIIMLTARAGEEDRIEGLETGIDDYLIKPFSPKELNVRVRNLIDQRRRLRERFGTATRITPSDVSAVSMDQEFVQRVLEAIEHNFGDDQYSVEVLADEIGMSVSQLNRKLGALIDQSAGKLIRSMRLQRAADLLTQQAGTVGEIAYQVGFGSQASFATAFKRQFGVSPSEYSRTES
jgi:DNA-binding response OmpR family regulator